MDGSSGSEWSRGDFGGSERHLALLPWKFVA